MSLCGLSHANAQAIRGRSRSPPRALSAGMDVTVGLGDRLGWRCRTHRRHPPLPRVARACAAVGAELTLTGRTFADVLDSATWAVLSTGYREPWGADGDHLKTEEQVKDGALRRSHHDHGGRLGRPPSRGCLPE